MGQIKNIKLHIVTDIKGSREMGRDRSSSPEQRSKSKKEKKKKKKKKSRHSSSSSEDSENEQNKKSLNYEAELQKFKEEHHKRKQLMKANETEEEKTRRRLLKKARKAAKRDNTEGVHDTPYSAHNSYDSQLTEAFVWKKKGSLSDNGGSAAERRRREAAKEEEVRIELEKVKKRKLDREAAKQARDEEAGLLQRQKEAAMFSNWEQQEDHFHLQQARLRTSIRIRDGRAKPIDLLAALVGLSIDDLEDLLEDIKVYVTIDKQENVEFWSDIRTIVKDELEKLKKQRNSESLTSRREVINPAVHKDVDAIFRGKTHAQLLALQTQMKGRMKSGGSIDVGYWESLLQQSEAYVAKARLKETHQKLLKKKLEEIKMESNIETTATNLEDMQQEGEMGNNDEEQAGPSGACDDKEEESKEEEEEEEEEEEMDGKVELQKLTDAEMKERAVKEYFEHAYNPKLLNFNEIEQEKLTEPEDDIRKLAFLREQVRSGSTVDEELEKDNMFNTQVLNENEEAFSAPVALTQKKYNWSDKYRPRKPRFFNRVHTGYEWNKYNQTHYDQDNPPPKVVQGYKFNIFYPDLIDVTATPEYIVTPCEDDKNFAVLRFKAGPPYEDIAFKIVNREWECAGRKGFRCQFNNKIFQLYFHFKRYRYRR